MLKTNLKIYHAILSSKNNHWILSSYFKSKEFIFNVFNEMINISYFTPSLVFIFVTL